VLKMLSSVSRFQIGRTTSGRFTNHPLQNMLMRLRPYRPQWSFEKVLIRTRFDGLVVDDKARQVLDQIDLAAFEIKETNFLEEIDAFFQKKHFTAMRMFEVTTPARHADEPDRVDLVIVAERKNYTIVNRHLPLQGREG
jgi:hypothetical protein